ncbi:MAG TPA: FAA hydrolase family protein, partial [Chloroflexi bacterium]|nr:FAA hydrolase family protein [Chloroflexota bacterium]
MKLVTYSLSGIPRLGTVFDDWVIDLARAYPAFRGIEGRVGRAGTDFPSDMLSFLRRGGEVWQVARQITDWVKSADLDSENASFVHPLSGVRLLPPVPDPGKIICVGLNYADHCREQNLEKPTSPVLFAKFPSSLIGPEETISWPPGSTEKVDYEAELA